jgi:Leucine-rich repeat (LRR) protein
MCKLNKLEDLSLSNNLLKELPECLPELKSLKSINIRKNPFPKYPIILEKIPNLKKFI